MTRNECDLMTTMLRVSALAPIRAVDRAIASSSSSYLTRERVDARVHVRRNARRCDDVR